MAWGHPVAQSAILATHSEIHISWTIPGFEGLIKLLLPGAGQNYKQLGRFKCPESVDTSDYQLGWQRPVIGRRPAARGQ